MFFEQQEGKTGCSQLSWLFEIPLLFTKVAPKFFQVPNRAELVYLSDSLRHSYRNVFRDTINIGSIQPSFKSDITSVVQILLYFILQKIFCDTYSSAFS